MRMTGFRAFMALWNTIDISRQRNCSNSASLISSTSRPAKSTCPPVINAGGCRMRKRAWAMVDFPLPDSPARPTTSPG